MRLRSEMEVNNNVTKNRHRMSCSAENSGATCASTGMEQADPLSAVYDDGASKRGQQLRRQSQRYDVSDDDVCGGIRANDIITHLSNYHACPARGCLYTASSASHVRQHVRNKHSGYVIAESDNHDINVAARGQQQLNQIERSELSEQLQKQETTCISIPCTYLCNWHECYRAYMDANGLRAHIEDDHGGWAAVATLEPCPGGIRATTTEADRSHNSWPTKLLHDRGDASGHGEDGDSTINRHLSSSFAEENSKGAVVVAWVGLGKNGGGLWAPGIIEEVSATCEKNKCDDRQQESGSGLLYVYLFLEGRTVPVCHQNIAHLTTTAMKQGPTSLPLDDPWFDDLSAAYQQLVEIDFIRDRRDADLASSSQHANALPDMSSCTADTINVDIDSTDSATVDSYGEKKEVTIYEYLVRWHGFGPVWDTWEVASSLPKELVASVDEIIVRVGHTQHSQDRMSLLRAAQNYAEAAQRKVERVGNMARFNTWVTKSSPKPGSPSSAYAESDPEYKKWLEELTNVQPVRGPVSVAQSRTRKRRRGLAMSSRPRNDIVTTSGTKSHATICGLYNKDAIGHGDDEDQLGDTAESRHLSLNVVCGICGARDHLQDVCPSRPQLSRCVDNNKIDCQSEAHQVRNADNEGNTGCSHNNKRRKISKECPSDAIGTLSSLLQKSLEIMNDAKDQVMNLWHTAELQRVSTAKRKRDSATEHQMLCVDRRPISSESTLRHIFQKSFNQRDSDNADQSKGSSSAPLDVHFYNTESDSRDGKDVSSGSSPKGTGRDKIGSSQIAKASCEQGRSDPRAVGAVGAFGTSTVSDCARSSIKVYDRRCNLPPHVENPFAAFDSSSDDEKQEVALVMMPTHDEICNDESSSDGEFYDSHLSSPRYTPATLPPELAQCLRSPLTTAARVHERKDIANLKRELEKATTQTMVTLDLIADLAANHDSGTIAFDRQHLNGTLEKDFNSSSTRAVG